MLRSSFRSCSHPFTRTRRDIGIGKSKPDLENHLLTCTRTIHGMVYNAMKLFMEINPQLFDDCSHDYTEHQNNAEAREQARESKWKALAEQAKRAKTNGVIRPVAVTTNSARSKSKVDELDP